MKKGFDLQEQLQSLLRPTKEKNMATRFVDLKKWNPSPAELNILSNGQGFNSTDAAHTNSLAGLESILRTSALAYEIRADIRNCATCIIWQKRYRQTLLAEETRGLRSLKSDLALLS
ncbi:unnamed protein product [Schistocephalus solidus]|uniref:Uncharacterized protein n=1 Tax=Schistocephalus solidus TaxID=70667 RepID=A0A183SXY5_SCHSO|nr:unnamed protein product [Schistocephalus solidus]